MDFERFDLLTRSVSTLLSRRVLAGVLGVAACTFPSVSEAKKHERARKKKRVKFNDFGCVNVGNACKNGSQCCSGICQGKRGKKRCRAHDASTCAGQDSCAGETTMCTTTDGVAGACFVTTGNAAHCSASGLCFACKTDADCAPICGAGAACIVCEDPQCAALGIETNCAGLFDDACFLRQDVTHRGKGM
jgi:hypothetical protein